VQALTGQAPAFAPVLVQLPCLPAGLQAFHVPDFQPF
jgi:hypothetical protein